MMTDPDIVFRSGSVRVDGRWLKKIRNSLGWTQQIAADKSGYTDRLIRKLERGGPVARDTLKDVLDTYRESLPQESRAPLPKSEQLVIRYSNPEVESLIRTWFERAFNQRDLSVVDELMHEQVVLYAEGNSVRGRDQIRQRVASVLAAFDPLGGAAFGGSTYAVALRFATRFFNRAVVRCSPQNYDSDCAGSISGPMMRGLAASVATLYKERTSVEEFISMVTKQLGIGESESRSATGGLLKMLKDQMDDDTFGSVMERLLGASGLLDAAESGEAGDSGGGGGLMGKLTSMAGGLLGGGGGAAGLAKIVGDSGIGLDKAGGFLSAFIGFLKAKLGDEMFGKLAANIPGFGDDE